MSPEMHFFQRGVEARLAKSDSSIPLKEKKSAESRPQDPRVLRAVEQTKRSVFLGNMPRGGMTHLERDIFILAFERLYPPELIIRVMRAKGISLAKFKDDVEKPISKLKLYLFVIDTIHKIEGYISREKIDLWQKSFDKFHKAGIWEEYIK